MPQFEHGPISRHEALAPFSRDHYVGLVKAHHLIKAAAKDDIARRGALSEFIDAWDGEIAPHCRDEERLLTDIASPENRDRLLSEHRRLEELAQTARSLHSEINPDPETVRQIGQALDDHIRWEERELFNRLQDKLTPDQLAQLGAQTAGIEQSRPRNIHRNKSDGREPDS